MKYEYYEQAETKRRRLARKWGDDKVIIYEFPNGQMCGRYFETRSDRDDFENRIKDDPLWSGFHSIGLLIDQDESVYQSLGYDRPNVRTART